jgi:type II secretory pathway component GspD/PulD (secretin)
VTPLLRALIVTGLLLMLDVAGGHAYANATETRIVQLKHRNADEVLPALLPLLDQDGRISGHQYQLFVRTSERNFAEIERVLQEIDTPLRNLRIAVRLASSRNTATSLQEVSADQRLSNNTRIVISPATPGRGGLVVRREGTESNVQYRSEQRTAIRSQDDAQFVRVIEGRRAYIAVGVALPQVQSYLVLAGNHLALVSGVTYRTVATGFEVLPRVRGAEVDLEITPRVAFLGDQGSQLVTFSELTTRVSVKTGEWVELGGILSNASQVGRTILGGGTRESQEQSGFQVRVDE